VAETVRLDELARQTAIHPDSLKWLFELILTKLREGDEVHIVNFGKFTIYSYPDHPQIPPERKMISFAPSRAAKDWLNQ